MLRHHMLYIWYENFQAGRGDGKVAPLWPSGHGFELRNSLSTCCGGGWRWGGKAAYIQPSSDPVVAGVSCTGLILYEILQLVFFGYTKLPSLTQLFLIFFLDILVFKFFHVNFFQHLIKILYFFIFLMRII